MTLSPGVVSAAGLGLGFVVDRLFGDPRRFHPVAGFGSLAGALEQRMHADSRVGGTVYVGLLVGGTAVLGLVIDRLTRPWPVARLLATAAATWSVLGGRSLEREAATVAAQLAVGELVAARLQIRNLVGRDPSALGPEEIARACVESVAENTSDAVVAPLFWGAVAGVPGLLAYRAVNTLDAMVGHRSERYLRFGWAAARLDDVLNWLPARLAGVLTVAAAGWVGGVAGWAAGSPTAAWQAMRRDSGRHPSPNAGVVEAAFAGALGVQLGGSNTYHGAVEDRGLLGDGRHVEVGDIARANRLARLVSVAAAVLAAGARLLRRRR
jgi:adenosylcobinamide-phosphate synthase